MCESIIRGVISFFKLFLLPLTVQGECVQEKPLWPLANEAFETHPSHLRGNDRQVWSLWGAGVKLLTHDEQCSGSDETTVVLTDASITGSSPMSETLPAAAVAAITINLSLSSDYLPNWEGKPLTLATACSSAHVNLTENTIVLPAMWNMFSHA